MDAPAPTLDSLVRPWRLAALIAGAVAGVELLMLIGGFAVIEPSLADDTGATPTAGAAKQAKARKPLPPLSPAQTRVLVLNGNGRSGAAHAEASQVKGAGYRIANVGNAERSDYNRSVVMYRQGRRREALRLAGTLGIRIVGPLDGLSPRRLGRAHVAVIVGQ